jgi:predicted TIM-barrel fold metal-dependent hydrolase
MDAFDRLVLRIAPLGWHVDLLEAALLTSSLPPGGAARPVIDHMGLVDASAGPEQPGFKKLLALLARDEKCWVKITGPARVAHRSALHDAVPSRASWSRLPARVLGAPTGRIRMSRSCRTTAI